MLCFYPMEVSGVSNRTNELDAGQSAQPSMRQIAENGHLIYLIDGNDQSGKTKVFGIAKDELERHHQRGSNVKLAQFLLLVAPGLILAEHIFRGLKRPLCDGEDMNADKAKLAFSWRPDFDYWWNERDKFDSRRLEFREAPDGKVFVVIASPNSKKNSYPSVDYWIERWFWVRRSQTGPKAPVDWETRYEEMLRP
jgi:hypothetical protein